MTTGDREPVAFSSRSIALACGIFGVIAFAWLLVSFLRGTDSDRIGGLDSAGPAKASAVARELPRLQTNSVRAKENENRQALDLRRDGWTSEAFSESAGAQVKRVIDTAAKQSPSTAALAEVLANSFVCSPLRPSDLQRVFQDQNVTVLRPPSSGLSESGRLKGATGLAASLAGVRQVFEGFQNIHTEVKTVSTKRFGDQWETLHIIHVSGYADSLGIVEMHADWRCRWEVVEPAQGASDTASHVPRLLSVGLESYEQTNAARPGPMFADATLAVFANEPVYEEQLSRGLDHWLSRIETTHGMYLFAEYGVAIGDVNGDGREDVYVCQPGGLPNRLLMQNEDGTVSDRSCAAKVDWLDHCSSALLVDIDNDGDLDLVVATEDRSVLVMENGGVGDFQMASRLPIADRHVQGLSAVDYDNDGDLDLYVTLGFADERARPNEPRPAFVYHDANEGGVNVLFRNELGSGELAFTDVTKQVGLDVNNRRHSLAAAWEDFDNDGDQDLYVANDYGQNCLYRNEGGRFQEVAATNSVVDFGSGMSVSWSDYDRDGDMDLYVGNMFSSAGNRITLQAGFQPNAGAETRGLLRRFAKGNTLFRNDLVGSDLVGSDLVGSDLVGSDLGDSDLGDSDGASDLGTIGFSDVDDRAGLQRGRWAWSSVFADLNNDGWEDVIVANGYMSRDKTQDL